MQLLFASVWSDPVTWATVVIAAFTVINVWVAIYQWKATNGTTMVTRTIFEGTHRPWLGVENTGCDPQGDRKILTLLFEIKNYGAVPALNTTTEVKSLRIGEHEVDADFAKEEGGYTIFPGASKKRTIYFRLANFEAVMHGVEKLEIDLLITYKGLAGQTHATSESRVYNPRLNLLGLSRSTIS